MALHLFPCDMFPPNRHLLARRSMDKEYRIPSKPAVPFMFLTDPAHLFSPSVALRVHFHAFSRLRILLLPTSTVRADAERYVSTLNSSSSKNFVARVDDPVVATETAVIALAILIMPKGYHLAFGDWLSHHSSPFLGGGGSGIQWV